MLCLGTLERKKSYRNDPIFILILSFGFSWIFTLGCIYETVALKRSLPP